MGFAAIGLYLFYFAYRYNMLYVSNAHIDTQGKAFVRALQHITVGCYLLMVCLIGLFAIGTASSRIALGPLILMIIFLVFVIIYHLSLNSALAPLIHFLPKNLEAEEEALLSREKGDYRHSSGEHSHSDEPGPSVPGQHERENGVETVDSAEKGLTAEPAHRETPGPANFLVRYLRPDKYSGYEQLRRWVPNAHEAASYSPEVESAAYHHPCISAEAPLLWIPRDELGISAQEVAHSSKVIPITDEDAWLDEKNHIHWDMDKGVPPIYTEKVHY